MTMDKLADTAVIAALRGGGRIMSVYCDPDADFQIERKADNSPLTIADRKADESIRAHLQPTGIPILSEEAAAAPYEERSGWRRLWIVDPLDGTKEFIGRRDDFTVNIALVEDGVPVLGVVYLPVFKTLYLALRGRGSFRVSSLDADATPSVDDLVSRGERLPLPVEPRPYTCVASVSHMNEPTRLFLDSLRERHPDLVTVSRGSSIKICLVAEGSADIYPRLAPTMEWDTAAGHAVALMAGRNVVEAGSKVPLRYNKPELTNPQFIVE